MKIIRMIHKDVNSIAKQILNNSANVVCDDIEVLDILLNSEQEFIILDINGASYTKAHMKRLRESIEFDPRGRYIFHE